MSTHTTSNHPPVAQVVAYFEHLSPQSVAQLARFYAPQARFKDPFKDVVGLPAIQEVFTHMFVALLAPRFVVTQQITQGAQCFLTWEFHFQFPSHRVGQDQVIMGASHLVFDSQGLITLHRDYWDAAEELYEKLPLVGTLMRWLKRRANS
jgi:hypothetical protein